MRVVRSRELLQPQTDGTGKRVTDSGLSLRLKRHASVPGVRVGAGNAARRKARPGEPREDGVSEFDDLEKKAQAYAEEHPEQADKGINEVAGFAERDTDHQHDEQIDRAVDAAEQHIGQGQDRQDNI